MTLTFKWTHLLHRLLKVPEVTFQGRQLVVNKDLSE